MVSVRLQLRRRDCHDGPAAGFYTTPGAGKNEVRVAYVLKKEDLVRALFVLRKAWKLIRDV